MRMILCLALFVVLFSLLSHSVLSLEDVKYKGVTLFPDTQCEEDDGCKGAKLYFHPCNDGNCWGKLGKDADTGLCNDDNYYTGAGSGGCYAYAYEDDAEGNDCAQASMKEGTLIDSKYRNYNSQISSWVGKTEEPDAKRVLEQAYALSLVSSSYICNQNKKDNLFYWDQCGFSDSTHNNFGEILTLTNDKTKVFICLPRDAGSSKYFEWQDIHSIGTEFDQDEDGVPDSFDTCAPNDILLHPSFPKDCVEVAEGKESPKGKVKCIIPASPEIAGNDIDENCDGKLVTDADDDQKSCETATLNALGVAYYWMSDAPKGSQCCGDDAEDFGKTFQTDAGERLCLPNDDKLVVSNKDNKGVKVSDIVDKSYCSTSWCSLPAPNVGIPFHIFTLKPSGKEPYDIVSNGNVWQECKEGKSVLDIPIGENAAIANGFSCYQEGNKWVWANCKPKASNEQTTQISNGIKDRVEGDGLFALPLKLPTENDEKKPIVEIKIGELYKSVYSDKSFDLIQQGDKQYLEAYIRFTNPKVSYPVTVNLKIVGPKVEKENVIYFNQPILGYATNTPLLEPNRWIHVKIPLPTLYDVTSLEFKSSPEANTIEIRNVYLTYGDNPKICSGEASTEQSAWLDDLDWWEES